MTENKRLLIIDGNSLIFRAYYAIQRPMITKTGQYTQGIYGFLNMLSKLQKEGIIRTTKNHFEILTEPVV